MRVEVTLTKRHLRQAADARNSLHRGATTGVDCPIARALDEILVPQGMDVYVASMGVVSLREHERTIMYAKLPVIAKWILDRFDSREEKWAMRQLPFTFDLEFKPRSRFEFEPIVGRIVFEPRGNPK